MSGKGRLKLKVKRESLARVQGGPGHRTTNFNCSNNAWETCISWCDTCYTNCWNCGA